MTTKNKTPTRDTLNTDLEVTQIDMMEGSSSLRDLPEEYTPVNQLNVPEEAKHHFKAKGYDLHWVRIYAGVSGELDMANIQRKQAAGYSFVERREVPGLTQEMSGLFLKTLEDSPVANLYIVGDLALAKIPSEKVKAKRRFIEEQTRSKNRAIIDDLRRNSVMPDATRGETIKIERHQPKARDVGFGD